MRAQKSLQICSDLTPQFESRGAQIIRRLCVCVCLPLCALHAIDNTEYSSPHVRLYIYIWVDLNYATESSELSKSSSSSSSCENKQTIQMKCKKS